MKLNELARDLAKYLLHGTIFTVLASILGLLWVAIFVFLALIGSILGIIIGFGVLFVFYGFANSLATRLLWFPVRKGLWIYLGQGLLLGIVLVIIEFVPLLLLAGSIITLSPSDLVITLVLVNVLFAFVDGFVGKMIGGIWREHGVRAKVLAGEQPVAPEVLPDVKNPDDLRCPRCRGARLVVEKDRSAYCSDCKRGIHPTAWTAGAG